MMRINKCGGVYVPLSPEVGGSGIAMIDWQLPSGILSAENLLIVLIQLS